VSATSEVITVRDLAALEEALGHSFQRRDLLQLALTHRSHAREADTTADNEQLEFLGDAVLSLCVAEELLQRFPHFQEGELSRLRAHLVSEPHLVIVARALDLGRYLQLGRGEDKSGGRGKPALLADALEAVLAALYLDAGFDRARAWVREKVLLPELQRLDVYAAGVPIIDYKSALQELLQATGRRQPAYDLTQEQGPEHKKLFTVEVRLLAAGSATHAEFVGRADGPTKKKAEQEAARQVLEYLESKPAP
jgi:ribonuclease-3